MTTVDKTLLDKIERLTAALERLAPPAPAKADFELAEAFVWQAKPPMFVPDGAGGERIAKRKLMNISISCDHRVVDGFDAASFVQAVRRLIEAPAVLLAG